MSVTNRKYKTEAEYQILHQKAQNYWDSLSNAEKETELSRVVENIKQGKYWMTTVSGQVEGSMIFNVRGGGSCWVVKNGKLISAYHDKTSPKRQNLVPGWICEEFYREDEFGVKKIGDNGEKILKLANDKPSEIEKGKSERNQKELSTTKNENEVKVNNDTNLNDKQNAQALVKFHSPETDKKNLEEKENKLIPTNTDLLSTEKPNYASATGNYHLNGENKEQKKSDYLMENLSNSSPNNTNYWIVGGIVIIALLVFALMLKRRRTKIIK